MVLSFLFPIYPSPNVSLFLSKVCLFLPPHVQRKDKSSSFTLAVCTCWLVKDLLKQDKVRLTLSLETSLVLYSPFVNLNTNTTTGHSCLLTVCYTQFFGHYNL